MADIILFQPKAELDASENLRGFIQACRNELTVFGKDLVFDDDVWDITDSISLKGRGHRRQRVIFSNLETVNEKIPTTMAEPFLPFAKAYLRYMQGVRPIVGVSSRVTALRALEDALRESGAGDPLRCDVLIFNRAAQKIVDKYTPAAAYRMGAQLEMIASFLSEHKLTLVPCNWRNFIKRPSDAVRVGKEFDKRREDKLPSQAALDALPEIFLKAVEPVDVIVSSIAAILCASPDRISEVLTLPLDCEVYQKNPKTNEIAYGLRWWPAKGAAPMVKWIVPSMASVVQEAIEKIRRVTNEARTIAKWYEEHPTQIYLSSEQEHFRSQEWLSNNEVNIILGFADRSAASLWCARNHIKTVKKLNKVFALFSDIEKVVLKMLPGGFPILDNDTGLKYSNALVVVRINELSMNYETSRCIITTISHNQVGSNLGGRVELGSPSIFTRHGYQEPDGSEIKIRTHQFRHYLNTLAQAGGLSQLDIAKWSGRKDIKQNAAYDHVTPGQMIQKIRDAIGDESTMFGPLAELSKKTLIPRDEFARLVVPTAHTTDLGYCIHDYTMSPCQTHMDCINCTDLVCIKGDAEKERKLRHQLDEARRLMAQAEQATKEEYFGSDRWFDHHKNTVERLSALLSIMDDPKVPNGAVIQLAPPKTATQKVGMTKQLNQPVKVINKP